MHICCESFPGWAFSIIRGIILISKDAPIEHLKIKERFRLEIRLIIYLSVSLARLPAVDRTTMPYVSVIFIGFLAKWKKIMILYKK